MSIKGHKTGYYATKGFESHIGGLTTRAQAKFMVRVIGALLLLITAAIPMAVKAGESDMMVAVKFQYNFGEPVRKSEFRVGMFTNSDEQSLSSDLGLLELRVVMGGGVKPFLLEQPLDSGLGKWGMYQIDRIKNLVSKYIPE